MEAFSLLKYWRTTATATADAATSPYSSDDGEDGPYFDLEFAVPDQDGEAWEEAPENEENSGNASEAEEILVQDELKFALAGEDPDEDEVFFKGDVVSIEPSSILMINDSDESSKIPVFLLKSATKFRVLLLKLKKSKSLEKNGKENLTGGKLFAVVDEVKNVGDDSSSDATGPLEDRKLTKQVVQKYLKMVKPFYIRASKRYVEKLKFTTKGCTAAPAPTSAPTNTRGGSNLQAGLKVVRKHLGKSRSASATATAPPQTTASNRRDDSLLQVQDGIQGAILHCKRSFNASRDEESSLSSSSILWRSVSDPTYEKSVMIPKAPCEGN